MQIWHIFISNLHYIVLHFFTIDLMRWNGINKFVIKWWPQWKQLTVNIYNWLNHQRASGLFMHSALVWHGFICRIKSKKMSWRQHHVAWILLLLDICCQGIQNQIKSNLLIVNAFRKSIISLCASIEHYKIKFTSTLPKWVYMWKCNSN